jgi:hypothetical protein
VIRPPIEPSRRSRGRRASRAVVAAAGLTMALAACNAGQEAQTAYQKPGVDGANAQVGALALRNVRLSYPEGGLYERGGTARLEFVAVNEGDERVTLVEVRTDAASRVTISAAGGTPAEGTASATPSESASASTTPSGTPSGSASASGSVTATPSPTATTPASARIDVPANGLVSFHGDGPAVTLADLTEELRAAQIVRITFVVEPGNETTLDVPVGVSLTEVEPPPTIDIQPPEEGGVPSP